MLNPVALFLYLTPVMDALNKQSFLWIVWKATLIAGVIYALFIVTWDYIFLNIFQIDFESFRLFGGIVIFTLAFMFIVWGRESFIHMRESLDDMASQLALPFMVGAGSISVSILIGNAYTWQQWLLLLGAVLWVNLLVIMLIKWIKDAFFMGALKWYFKNILAIVFRLNSFFMGAVGIDMTITAVRNIFSL